MKYCVGVVVFVLVVVVCGGEEIQYVFSVCNLFELDIGFFVWVERGFFIQGVMFFYFEEGLLMEVLVEVFEL